MSAGEARVRIAWGSRPALVTLGLIAALASLGVVGRSASSQSPRSDELRVLLATPRGEQDALYSIEVSFSLPMVALGERGEEAPRSLVRFSPPLAGRGTWLGTSAFSFVLREPPPSATRITCTIPAGTKSLSGAALERDHVWTIDYARPRLLASSPEIWIPPPAERSKSTDAEPPAIFPTDDPFYLAFDRPIGREAATRIELVRDGVRTALHPIGISAEVISELAERAGRDTLDARAVVGLRAEGALAPGARYELLVPADLSFEGATLGLREPLRLPFRTLDAPAIASVEADPWTLRFRLRAPIDPDSLLAHLRFDPPLRRASAWAYDPMVVNVDGRFSHGRPLAIQLTPGLSDLYGRRVEEPFATQLDFPHDLPTLELEPASGALIPGPAEFVRIKAENVGPVEIRGVWLRGDEIVHAIERESTDRPFLADDRARWPKGTGRWLSFTWDGPAQRPDSMHTWLRRLDELTPRPTDAVALYLEAAARPLFPRREDEPPPRARTLLQLANIGITSRFGAEHGLLWVTDLSTGAPVSGAALAVWAPPDSSGNLDAAPLWSGRTDQDGLAWTPGLRTFAPLAMPRYVSCQSAGRRAWLELSTRWGWAESIAEPAPPAAFLFTDRPLYRPGERVEWKAYVRDANAKGLRRSGLAEVEAVLEREGTVLATERVRLTALGNAHGAFALDPDTHPGTHLLTLREIVPTGDGRTLTSAGVSVEHFRAPRFRARVEVAPEQITSGGSARGEGRFEYFAGGALGGQPVEWFLSLSPMYWRPPGWDAFSFHDDAPSSSARRHSYRGGAGSPWAGSGPALLQQGTALLDRDGSLGVDLPVTLPPEAGDSRALFEMGARDLADQSAFDRASFRVLRGPLRVGVRAVYRDQETRSSTIAWEWVVTDTAGRIVPGENVRTEVVRQDWKTVRVRRLGGVFDYENYPADTLVATGDFVSLDRPFEQRVTVPGPGLYRLRASLPGKARIAAAAPQWVAGPEETSGERPTTWWIQLGTDRDAYASDDTVRVVVPAPTSGAHALVVLESGDLIRARALRLDGTPDVAVPLGGLAPPDATVSATLVGPDRVPTSAGDGPRRFLPYHANGSTSFAIEPGRWRAQVELIPSKAMAAPGETISMEIRLRDATGAPASGEVTLWGVDEAILALSGDAPTDPLTSLLAYRGSEILRDDLREQLRLSPALERGKESIGGGGAERAGLPVRRNFRPTAYWNPSIAIGQDGLARVEVSLPDDLTRYRFRAVAATAQQGFGWDDVTVHVSRDLEIEAALPRFARVGDRFDAGGVVRNRSDRTIEVDVTCAVEGGRLRHSGHARLELAPGENRRADFPVEADRAGSLRVSFAALEREEAHGEGRRAGRDSGLDGAALNADRVTRSLDVQRPLFRETEVAFGRALPRRQEAFDPRGLPEESAGLRVTVAASLASGLEHAADHLIDFPHACLEQLDSRLLGHLARKRLADRFTPRGGAVGDATAVDEALQRTAREIANRLGPDGFAVWPMRATPDASLAGSYLLGYTAFALARAESAGVMLPSGLLDETLLRIDERLERGRSGLQGTGVPAGALSAGEEAFLSWVWLEAAGARAAITESDLERLHTRQDELGVAGRVALALAYDRLDRAENRGRKRGGGSAGGMTTRIRSLVEMAAESADRTGAHLAFRESIPGALPAFGADEADRVRATALAVLALTRRQPDHALLPLAVRWLLDERTAGRWGNTHENAWALCAIEEYVAAAEVLSLPLDARVVAGGSEVSSTRFDSGRLQPSSILLTRDALARISARGRERDAPIPISIETSGASGIYYDLRLDRALPAMEREAREEGLSIWREYVTARGEPARLERLVRGEPALVHLAVVVPRAASYLLVEDALPAGVEPVHLEFETTSRTLFASGDPIVRPIEGNGIDALGGTPSDSLRLPVAHRERLDDRVRFYADQVPAGVYHLYYPVTPTTSGRFRTPGARIERLYAPEVYGLSEPVTIEVK